MVAPGVPSVILVPAKLRSISVVRTAIRHALDRSGWDHESASQVVLAVSEATANAVEHGSRPGELVEVVYAIDRDAASIRILDEGHGPVWIPPREHRLPAHHSDRGRGLYLIHELADRLEIVTNGPGTELRLHFTPSPAENLSA